MFALEIREARETLDNLVYTGERLPQMYWTKSEQQLNTAFATYVKVEGIIVHLDIMKLTHLMTKVKCDSLNAGTAALTVAILLWLIFIIRVYVHILRMNHTRVNLRVRSLAVL